MNSDFDKEYEIYKKECKRIREVNAQYMKLFEKYLKTKKLAPKTIKNHLENVDLFINDYILQEDALTIREGMTRLDSFFYFFIHKCMWSTPDTVGKTASSLKKFYKCMAENNIVDPADYESFASEIKEGVPLWKEECEDFNAW